MGCCASTNYAPNSKRSRKQNGIGQSPPATCQLPEEETIKEVLSETTTTQKFHEKNNDYADEKKHHRNGAVYKKPFSACNENDGEFHGTQVKRENDVGKCTGREPEQFPGQNGPGYGRRKCSGGSSGRRSRSPVMRKESEPSKTGLGGGQSWRKTDKSCDRVGSGSDEKIRKVDDGKESGEIKWPPTRNELLENTHVSLECFIFL